MRWQALREMKHEPKKRETPVVRNAKTRLLHVEYDVCVCGSTLGILFALALQLKGYKVCLVEKRSVKGRQQACIPVLMERT